MTVNCYYTVQKYGTPSPSPLAIGDNLNASATLAPTYTCDQTGASAIPLPALSAGDQVCVNASAISNDGSFNPGLGAGVIRLDRITKAITEHGPEVTTSICRRIVNKPYVSFYGNDVKVGGDVAGMANCERSPVSGIKTFNRSNTGSAAQIAAFALDSIGGLTTAVRGTGDPAVNSLTAPNFDNYGPNCTYDFYADASGIPWPGSGLTPAMQDKFTHSGPLTLSAMTITRGQHVFLYVDGDVTITGNITMDQGPWTDRSEIPSFYLASTSNIIIQNSVEEVAGAYIAQKAGKAIYTCAEGGIPLDASVIYANCGNPLTINGAFIAKKVVLGRAFGSLRNATSDDPFVGVSNKNCSTSRVVIALTNTCAAESFRYNPSLYLGLAPRTLSDSSTYSSDYDAVANLPPVL